ncbi:hypothetical protein ABPG75_009262 [Micractinium tetrahymenae]
MRLPALVLTTDWLFLHKYLAFLVGQPGRPCSASRDTCRIHRLHHCNLLYYNNSHRASQAMRSAPLLATIVALCVGLVQGGPVQTYPGCYWSDTVKTFPVSATKGFTDRTKKNFVQSAWIQARENMRTHPLIQGLIRQQKCRFDVIEPIRACYNSIVPGFLGAKQWKGQYGFYAKWYIICPNLDNPVVIWCKSRSNTLRANRYGNDDYWVPQDAIFEWQDYCADTKWPW